MCLLEFRECSISSNYKTQNCSNSFIFAIGPSMSTPPDILAVAPILHLHPMQFLDHTIPHAPCFASCYLPPPSCVSSFVSPVNPPPHIPQQFSNPLPLWRSTAPSSVTIVTTANPVAHLLTILAANSSLPCGHCCHHHQPHNCRLRQHHHARSHLVTVVVTAKPTTCLLIVATGLILTIITTLAPAITDYCSIIATVSLRKSLHCCQPL